MPRRIAIVEDDPVIRANYADVLKKHGYDVLQHANRPDALAALRTRLPDLVLLDIGLGDEIDGGFTLCRDLRALSSTLPIIFLTARDSDFDTVSGLRMGADDYVTKNMSLPHLLARVSALFRRADLAQQPRPKKTCWYAGRCNSMCNVFQYAGTGTKSNSRSPNSGWCMRWRNFQDMLKTASN